MEKVNKVTLKFSDENIEKNFRKEYYDKSITMSRISFVIVILLYAAFGYIDRISSENYYKIFFTIRYLIVIPFLTGVLLFSFNRNFIKVWQRLISLCFIVGGIGIIYMLVKNPENIYYYGGLFLIFNAGYFFVKLRFFAATVSGILLLIIYNIGIIIFQVLNNIQFDYVIITNAFYISANIINSIALYNMELLERKGYYQQNLLIDKQNEISLTNQTLEVKINDRTKQLRATNQQLIANTLILNENEKKFRSLFSEMTEGVYLHEIIYNNKGKAIDYRIIDANPASNEILKIKTVDAIGKLATELYGIEEAPYLDIYAKVAKTSIPFGFEEYFPPLKKHFHISVYSPEKGKFATIFSDITERKQAEEQIKKDLKIKTALIQEIYHRTKNNMAVISAMLSMQSRRSENEYAKSTFREISNKIQAMSLVHQKLYKAKDLSNINLKDYIEDLANLIMQSYGVLSEKIKIKFDLQDVKISIDSAVPLGLIINELVSNIFKHAFPNRQEGEIFIRLFKEKDETINLELIDNGIGFSSEFDPRKDGSMGLTSVLSIAENQLKGEISVKSENGLSWHIKIKDDKKKERI